MTDRTSTIDAALAVSRAIAAREIAARGADLLDPAFRYHGAAGMELDRDAYVGFMAALGEAFPDMAMTFEPVIADGSRVGVHWVNAFTHRGAYMGVEPTGRSIVLTGTFIREVADGRVVEEWDTTDIFGLAGQLGLIPGAA
ncbi:MAG: ester cyclase [Chloroflexota bacterium]